MYREIGSVNQTTNEKEKFPSVDELSICLIPIRRDKRFIVITIIMSGSTPQPDNQSAMVKRAASTTPSDSQLMPPPPPPKHIKRPATVLEEDDYTSTLSHIIARDFFPGLVETQAQQEYLDALKSHDKTWIASAGKRMAEAMTPVNNGTRGRRGVSYTPRIARGTPRGTAAAGETPASVSAGMGLSTPMSTAGTEVSAAGTAAGGRAGEGLSARDKRLERARDMSLSEFQAKFTSEDNESFNKILDKSNHKRREKYAWIWSGNKIPSAKQIAHRKREAKRIEAQAAPSSSSTANTELITTDLDARPAQLDHWKPRAAEIDVDGSVRNSLMFTPPSIDDSTLDTRHQAAEATSHMGPKTTNYQNTRMPHIAETTAAAAAESTGRPPSPTLSSIRDAIAGHARLSESEAGGTAGGGGGSTAGNETPRVNGYAFVDEDEPDEEYYNSFLRTSSGDIGGGIGSGIGSGSGSGDTGPNPFRLPENRKREELHHRMVHRVAQTKREEEKSVISGLPSSRSRRATPGTSGRRLDKSSLTPAARRLFKQVGSSTPRHRHARASPLSESPASVSKDMWTPNRTAQRRSRK